MSSNVPVRLVIVLPILLALATADLAVLVAPSVWDSMYEPIFRDVVRAQIGIAHAMAGRDDVIIVADKHTLPYYTGRTDAIDKRVDESMLLQADIYDIHVRDFAPVGARQLMQFTYADPHMDAMFAHQVHDSMARFMRAHNLTADRVETELHMTAADVVDNGRNKALVNENVVPDNVDRMPDWAVKVKMLSAMKQVAYVPVPADNGTQRLDDFLAWIDDDVLLVGDMPDETLAEIKDQMRRRLYEKIAVVQLPPGHRHDDTDGSCGTYMGIVATKNHVYVPVYGNDAANWAHGHSAMMDAHVVQLAQVSTRKTVVPVNVPRALCANGINLRSLVWSLKGARADQLIGTTATLSRRQRLLAHRQ